MNTSTGHIITPQEFEKLPPQEKSQYIRVQRDLSVRERATAQISLYAPCGCGSGKKFKFCCKTNPKEYVEVTLVKSTKTTQKHELR